MILQERIQAFSQLGKALSFFETKQPWPGYDSGLTEGEYDKFNELIATVHHFNGWFLEENVRQSIGALKLMLDKNKLEKWVTKYDKLQEPKNKTAAIIMAGNIPLVGFHDFLSVLISGCKVKAKLASDDNKLLPYITDMLIKIEPKFKEYITFVTRLNDFDAIIATGSDNSARYFESYFGKYPHIIRKNRTSIAVINGNETEEELDGLAKDVFSYFGLGCRNVTKVFVPKDYDLDNLFKVFFKWKDISNNNKYANNYDYNKAVYLMNKIELIENGFLMLKEDEGLHSPLSVLFYQYYSDTKEVQDYIENNKEKLQCIVSQKETPFGKAQQPELWDYADGIDTLSFLASI
jgi:hypothetical protein